MKAIAIIPARYASTRLPGKPLLDLNGKTIIQRVYERIAAAKAIAAVAVATDDQRIMEHVHGFGGDAYLTADTHRSGTDRIAEVANTLPEDFDVIVNVQGDEPFVTTRQIEILVQAIGEGKSDIATLAHPLTDSERLFDPNVVKVVFNRQGNAMYFSRSVIPYVRDEDKKEWIGEQSFFQHLGMYAFRRDVLLEVTALLPSRYEQLESLEQLRWLDYGKQIKVVLTQEKSMGIDTPNDLERAKKYLAQYEKR